MIKYWEEKNGKLFECNQDADAKNMWIDARSINREDIRILEETYNIDQEHILDILDQDEISRIEQTDDYTLIILRLPLYKPDSEISYITVPLGIVLFKNTIITICWTDCEVLHDLSANRIKDLTLNDFTAMIIRILSRSDTIFLRYLKEINRRSTAIQQTLERSVKNNELMLLLNLGKSLEFFATSLKGNQMLLEKITKSHILKLDADDKDWLEDVTIDNKQALEMTNTYSNILTSMMETFASVISNNLNIVMKRLTVISLVLMVPTFIVSFFGMNVPLPFAHTGWAGVIVISFVCLITTGFTTLVLSDRRKSKKVPKIKEKRNNR